MSRIVNAYTSPGHEIAFSGPSRAKSVFKEFKSHKDILQELEGQNVFTLHRKKFKPRIFNPFFVHEKRSQIQMDLIDMQNLAQWNDGVKYLLVGIDSFTKKASALPILNKTAASTLSAIKLMLNGDLKPKPKFIIMDRGKEFTNAFVNAYFGHENIKVINPNGEHKAAIAERFNRTLQNLIYPYLTHNNTKRYIDVLPDLLHTYNSRVHRTIKMSPNKAEKSENHNLVRQNLGLYYDKSISKRKKPRLKVGEIVRIKSQKGAFNKGYRPSFSELLYEITAVKTSLPMPMYSLRDVQDGEEIIGGFYEEEIQIVRP